jgi:hypothetical protein
MNLRQASPRAVSPGAVRLFKPGCVAVWLLAMWLLAGNERLAAQSAGLSAYQVKAAFLYNFGKFVEWPATTFTNTTAPLVIGVFGDDPFHGDLERIISKKNVAGHPVVVRHVSSPADVKGCEIIFVSVAQHDHAAVMAGAIQSFGILTVTEDMSHFADSGYAISFITVDDSIHFEINNAAALKAGLNISSKLLALAKTPEK